MPAPLSLRASRQATAAAAAAPCRGPHAAGPSHPAPLGRFGPLLPARNVLARSQQQDVQQQAPSSSPAAGAQGDFCIIETRDTVRDFSALDTRDISQAIYFRRNKIFLLLEEVRRLRIQQRLKGGKEMDDEEEARRMVAEEKFRSALPLLPPLSEKSLNTYYLAYASLFSTIILFGGILAPMAQVKLGLGGVSYREFVDSMHLPSQLAQVDPIVASFCGGAVGVLSALLVVEVNNIKAQQKDRCHYCMGAGYLTCGHCVGSGVDSELRCGCLYCSSTGKVMCTSCLCTGKQMATEHDPRIDPFSEV